MKRPACRNRRLPLRSKSRVLRLRDLPRNPKGGYNFDALTAAGERLFAVEVWHAYRAQLELDEAAREGVITPAQRPYFERLAALDQATFRGLLATMRREGIGGQA